MAVNKGHRHCLHGLTAEVGSDKQQGTNCRQNSDTYGKGQEEMERSGEPGLSGELGRESLQQGDFTVWVRGN